MATYIIGDLQGCFDELQRLLEKIDFQAETDQLWFAGDLINRGPKSLECLTFVKDLGDSARAVLGNHDFHLLAAYAGLEKYRTKSDTLKPILQHPKAEELVDWLRHQPLLVEHELYSAVMVHAGIPPQWTISEAKNYAKEVEAIIQHHDWQTAIREHLFGSDPKKWNDSLDGWPRIRYILNSLVRMRYCDENGKLEFKEKMAPGQATVNPKYQPWFTFPNRKNKDHQIFFGHWSTLGAMDAYQVHATDTGCLWGGQLTAYCLETQQRITVDCTQQQPIKK